MKVRTKQRLADYLSPAVSFGALLTLWEVLVRWLGVSPIILPPPSRVIQEFVKRFDQILFHSAVTMFEAFAGLVVGVLFALICSFLISEVPTFRRAVYPLILAKQVVPTIVFAPILLVWFGYGVSSKIVISATICFFPIVVNSLHGLNSLPPEIVELARSLGSTRWKILWRLRVPHSVPSVFAAMKPTVGLAMIGAVVGEFIGGNFGLGYMIVESLRFMNLSAMFAATIALIILGMIFFAMVELVGIMFLGWYRKSLRLSEVL
jgi:ABC-type nitrate/sulfonate/bicarbonate transport system permease component